MFDSYDIRLGVPGPVHCHEHRAPTDESVRLLKEMESAARDKVVESMRIQSAGVEAVVHRHDDFMDMRSSFHVCYRINNTTRVCKFTADYGETIESQMKRTWECVAKDLAAYLLIHAQDPRRTFRR